MKKMGCSVCEMRDVKSGKDLLLFEDDDRFIIKNGNTHLKVGGEMRFYKTRYTYVLKDHVSRLTKDELKRTKSQFHDFLKKKIRLKRRDYFLKVTMGTFPEHFHIHSYLPPYSKKGVIMDVG